MKRSALLSIALFASTVPIVSADTFGAEVSYHLRPRTAQFSFIVLRWIGIIAKMKIEFRGRELTLPAFGTTW